jgi:hypothetical protein
MLESHPRQRLKPTVTLVGTTLTHIYGTFNTHKAES